MATQRRVRGRAGPGGSARSSASVLKKLEKRVEDGDYYEALQMYKTLHDRHVSNSNFEEAEKLVVSGTLTLLKMKQLSEGTELARVLIALFATAKKPVDEESRATVMRISNAYSPGPEQLSFLKAALKWSSTAGARSRGDPELRMLLAHAAKECGDFAGAAQQYLFADQPEEFAALIWEWSGKGYASERDLFIARAVLQLLSLENLRDANLVFDGFNARAEKKGVKIDTPLMNFVRFLLVTCERDAAPLFQMLTQRYASSLRREESFQTYLSLIGQKFFNIQPPPGLGSMLANMMNMFGGGDDE
jgi:hypothetical protein